MFDGGRRALRVRQDDPRDGDGARPAQPAGVMLYGGSIMPGRFHGRDVSIQDVFEGVGAAAAGVIDDEELHELECAACPGAGACGGQFTANTMATAFEAMGISPMGSGTVPATRGRSPRWPASAAAWSWSSSPRRERPRQILTRARSERGGARGRDRRLHQRGAPPARHRTGGRGGLLTLDDFDRISARTPVLADMKPWGRYVAADIHAAGGVALVASGCTTPGTSTRPAHGDGAHARRGDRAGEGAAGPGGRPLHRPPDQEATGGLVILKRQPRSGRLRAQDRRPERQPSHGAGARVRGRGGRVRRGAGGEDPEGRRGDHPLRGTARWSRHARNARRHGGARRGGARCRRRAADGRPLLRARPTG
jgi:hypothetical protein